MAMPKKNSNRGLGSVETVLVNILANLNLTLLIRFGAMTATVVVTLGLILYLKYFGDQTLLVKSFLFHEIMVLVSVVWGLSIAFIAFLCYREKREPFLRFMTLAFFGQSIIYSLHGLLTATADWMPILFILYGPASRVVMALLLFYALLKFGDNSKDHIGRKYWAIWAAVFILILPIIALLAFSPIGTSFYTRAGMEALSIVIYLAAFGVIVYRKIKTPLMFFYAIAITFFIQSSLSFIFVEMIWNHMFWLAHAFFAAGFLIINFGLLRAYQTSTSFSEVFNVEAELIASEARYRNLSEGSLQGIHVHRGFKSLYVNKAFIQMFGFASVNECLNLESFIYHVHADDRERMQELSKKWMSGEVVSAYVEFRGVDNDDDATSWFQSYNKIIQWDGANAVQSTILDITKRKQAEEKAKELSRQQEQNLNVTLNSIGDAVITTDDKGNVTRMNPIAEKLTGWSLQEAQDQPLKIIFSIINASTREPIDNPVDKVIATGETIHLSNHTALISKDGTEYQIADSAAPIKDNGKILGMVLVFNDVTERYLKDEQLRRSQKMDALGKLTGGIAHDYNNMLGIILGYSEIIEEMAIEQPKLTKYINEIRHAGERGAKLTKKFLSFSRLQSSENKIINLNTLLEDSQLMLEKTLTVRISLVFELEKNCWSISLDESDLEDAILNMSINAMHAIEGSGLLTFETRNEAIKEIDAQHLQIPEGDYVLLSITDTGCGMDNKTKENIFDPFFSTKGEFGTGLGLSQVYGFVQRSKGNIKIYSELGQGSRFTLYFPRYYESDIEEKQFKELEETNLSGNQIILVVDDEPALAELSSHILTEHGYHVFTANSGKEALLILKKEAVDVLLSDVIMPEMDGYELASIVQEKYPNIKIQMASGFNDERHAGIVNASLHEKLLHKPYHSKKLLLRIRELLNGSAD